MSSGFRVSLTACLLAAIAHRTDGDSPKTEAPDSRRAPSTVIQASGCTKSDKYRQLDFWLGTWIAAPWTSPPGTRNATNVIQSILDGCAVFESYSGNGYEGKSFNYYDPHLDRWRQVWVDNGGTISEVVGGFHDGVFQLMGEGFNPRGVKITRRMTLRRIAADTLRHTWESSADGGRNWTTVADVRYTR